MTTMPGASGRPQEIKRSVETSGDLGEAERFSSRRGQLNRQGKPVEPLADGRRQGRGGLVERKARND